ncbi:hypothetical protein AV530_007491 [Patagioenas fasciata monilis]|uniref:Uncharacterized protein n=1 Tax=Patagioenas fasciata monilis TaxID=372326 RepID=A0A1V4JXZ1_PATFA|nr:hypothetical protein AV530_007491 [Patagioenas fasciata monilis]
MMENSPGVDLCLSPSLCAPQLPSPAFSQKEVNTTGTQELLFLSHQHFMCHRGLALKPAQSSRAELSLCPSMAVPSHSSCLSNRIPTEAARVVLWCLVV